MKRIGIMLFQLLVTAARLWYVFHDAQRRPDTPYSSLIESDLPIVVQHTRLDSRQAENALLITMAFPCD
jgi:hypothetical protein